jgi:hypothetical protein
MDLDPRLGKPPLHEHLAQFVRIEQAMMAVVDERPVFHRCAMSDVGDEPTAWTQRAAKFTDHGSAIIAEIENIDRQLSGGTVRSGNDRYRGDSCPKQHRQQPT